MDCNVIPSYLYTLKHVLYYKRPRIVASGYPTVMSYQENGYIIETFGE